MRVFVSNIDLRPSSAIPVVSYRLSAPSVVENADGLRISPLFHLFLAGETHIVHILMDDYVIVRQLAIVQYGHPRVHQAVVRADVIYQLLRLISRPLPASRAQIPRLIVESKEIVRGRILAPMRNVAQFIECLGIETIFPRPAHFALEFGSIYSCFGNASRV